MLWIGFRVDTRELLVTLTIRLKVILERHNRKRIPRKGRPMFMVTAVELLTIRYTDIAYHELVKNSVPEPFLNLLSDHESATCRILIIEINSDTKSCVIMTEEPDFDVLLRNY